MLISLGHFPPALSSAVRALDSILQSFFMEIPVTAKSALAFRLHQMDIIKKQFRQKQLDDLCYKSVIINQQGYKTSDDQTCIQLLIEIALPALFDCYTQLFKLELKLNKTYAALLTVLQSATKINNTFAQKNTSDNVFIFHPFGCYLRSVQREHFTPNWTQTSDSIAKEKFNTSIKWRNALEETFGSAIILNCPICSDKNTLICILDNSAPQIKEIKPIGMTCLSCNFELFPKYKFLADYFIHQELENNKDDILAESKQAICWSEHESK